MRDYFGDEALKLKKIREILESIAEKLNFNYVEIPAVEQELLYTSSLGLTSDVVEKEMFYLTKKEKGSALVLKPEATASVVRMYLENGFSSLSQPVKVYYFERLYRREKPQHGRYREHRQFGLEILGSQDPFCDFEVINTFYFILQELKVPSLLIGINTLGCLECRDKYKKNLKDYYRKLVKKLCDDCKRRLSENPLRLLDCKNETCQTLKGTAPNILNYLCRDCSSNFQKVIEYIDIQKLPYQIDHTLVRGFDYYNRTIFEIFSGENKLALVGGGRYDYLANFISNQNVYGVGGSLGVERVMDLVSNFLSEKKNKKLKIFVCFVGEETRLKAYNIFLHLIKHNFQAYHMFNRPSLSGQLEIADKLGIKYALILGLLEVSQNTIILRDMVSGHQEILSQSNLIEELKQILK